MKEWLETGIHQVNALLRNDEDFQELMCQLPRVQGQYEAVIRKLSLEDREIIGNYIAFCEEVEYQKAQTAYYCGKRNG